MKIHAGYSANAEIVLERATKTICVPEASLEFSGDSTYVYVLTDTTSSKQTFERRAVTTGISDGLNIEIKKGLQVGSKVRGIEKMKE